MFSINTVRGPATSVLAWFVPHVTCRGVSLRQDARTQDQIRQNIERYDRVPKIMCEFHSVSVYTACMFSVGL